jgi:hypothetical protein
MRTRWKTVPLHGALNRMVHYAAKDLGGYVLV